MADIVDPATRSRMMSGIRGRNTKPEIAIRLILHKAGFRYRLHGKSLPGKPDLVFPKYHAVIFVHGCFWHGHSCPLFKWPSTKVEFWRNKITQNQARDVRQLSQLEENKWRVCIIWECALRGANKNLEDTCQLVGEWLKGSESFMEIRG